MWRIKNGSLNGFAASQYSAYPVSELDGFDPNNNPNGDTVC